MIVAQIDGAAVFCIVLVASVALIVFLAGLILFQKHYKRCPPNRLLVIYGAGQARVIHGEAAFVIPILQDYAYLSLEPLQIPVAQTLRTRGEKLGIHLPEILVVAISTQPGVMQNAAVRLLGLPVNQIEAIAHSILEQRLEQLLDQYKAPANQSSEANWRAQLADLAEPELNAQGLTLMRHA